jgi:hypothetical protein
MFWNNSFNIKGEYLVIFGLWVTKAIIFLSERFFSVMRKNSRAIFVDPQFSLFWCCSHLFFYFEFFICKPTSKILKSWKIISQFPCEFLLHCRVNKRSCWKFIIISFLLRWKTLLYFKTRRNFGNGCTWEYIFWSHDLA